VGGPAGFQEWVEILQFLPEEVLIASYAPGCLADTNPRIKGLFRDIINGNFFLDGINFDSYLSVIPNSISAKIESLKPGQDVLRALKLFNGLESRNGWKILSRGETAPLALAKVLTSLAVNEKNPAAFCALVIHDWDYSAPSTSANRWIEVLGTAHMPFNKSLMEKLERAASKELGILVDLRRAENIKKHRSSAKTRANKETEI
jgi:hypothetical protein